MEYPSSSVLFIFADRDIQKGEELVIDYCKGVESLNERNLILSRYHISELYKNGVTEPLEVPEENDDDPEYVDVEKMVKDRQDLTEKHGTVATGIRLF